jgi:hypothetical protein
MSQISQELHAELREELSEIHAGCQKVLADFSDALTPNQKAEITAIVGRAQNAVARLAKVQVIPGAPASAPAPAPAADKPAGATGK